MDDSVMDESIMF
jgi:hypothetical protein